MIAILAGCNVRSDEGAEKSLSSDQALTPANESSDGLTSTDLASEDCSKFGSPDQLMTGVMKWGVSLDEATERLECMGFEVGPRVGNTDLKPDRMPLSSLTARLGQTTVRLTFTDLSDEEQVVRAQLAATFQKSDSQPLNRIIAQLVDQYGPFVSSPDSPPNSFAGMIARDVDAEHAGEASRWSVVCFQAANDNVLSTQACGETILYYGQTFPDTNHVRSFNLSVDNYRATAAAVARTGGRVPGPPNDIAVSDGVYRREAQDITTLCSQNREQRSYFNCGCLGEAFLEERRRSGTQVPQFQIFKKVTNSAAVNPSCVNSPEIRLINERSCRRYCLPSAPMAQIRGCDLRRIWASS
ncbi:hypothetical protein [Aurantiacibacter xanthus]|uniref:hypothetical protein n=1 Tax=Aurantiacibacter xanthus TaxID=1784712 RepID=UPI0017482812|nr:hypothetical protein [Aurantiacibacter xanthus]